MTCFSELGLKYINFPDRCVVFLSPDVQSLLREFSHHIQDNDSLLPISGEVFVDERVTLPKGAFMLLDQRLYTHRDHLFVLDGSVLYRISLATFFL